MPDKTSLPNNSSPDSGNKNDLPETAKNTPKPDPLKVPEKESTTVASSLTTPPADGKARLTFAVTEAARIPEFQMFAEKIGLEIYPSAPAKGFKQWLRRTFEVLGKDYGALITGVISLIITVVIAYFAHTISKQQAESLKLQVDAEKAQAKTAEDEVNVKFTEEFKTHLSELTAEGNEADLTKRRLAAITLAQYGERVLPALKMSLAVNENDIREGAAVVVIQMLADRSLRGSVLAKLKEYFDEDNPALKVGVLECYLTVNTGLTESEFEDARNKIRQHIDPAANYSNKPEQQRVLLWAVKFFSYWPRSSSKDFLLAVAGNSTCGDEPREGALNYLPIVTKDAADLNNEQRQVTAKETADKLRALLPDASERLKANITAAIQNLESQ